MKKKTTIKNQTLVILLLIGICISCKTTSTISKKMDPIQGVWKLNAFYTLANGDTIVTKTDKVQHKIYLNGHVIWNTDPEPNGNEWHGYGTYTYENNTITEELTSMSKSMISDVNAYIIPIEIGLKTYKQVNTYTRNDTIFKNIEVYKKLD
jgi:hypothetical protein